MCIMHKHTRVGGVWGYAPPGNFLEIRCSEIASEAILEQKQNRNSYMARTAGRHHHYRKTTGELSSARNSDFLKAYIHARPFIAAT